MMRICAKVGSALMRRPSSNPSIPGMIRSTIARSKGEPASRPAFSAMSPSAALVAVATLAPQLAR